MGDKTLYVVTAGEYSDYHIVAIYDDRKLAEAVGGRCIEEFPLNPGRNQLCAGLRPHEIEMARDGVVLCVKRTNTDSWDADLDAHLTSEWSLFPRGGAYWKMEVPRYGFESCRARYEALCHWRSKLSQSLTIKVMARDEEHAVKIANEKRTQLIATEQWPVGEMLEKLQAEIDKKWPRIMTVSE